MEPGKKNFCFPGLTAVSQTVFYLQRSRAAAWPDMNQDKTKPEAHHAPLSMPCYMRSQAPKSTTDGAFDPRSTTQWNAVLAAEGGGIQTAH